MHPSGREMSEQDWYDTDLHAVGMFVSGDPLRSPGPRGEQQHDCSFLMWLNGGARSGRRSRCPRNEWVSHGEVVLSTDPDHRRRHPRRRRRPRSPSPAAPSWCSAQTDHAR